MEFQVLVETGFDRERNGELFEVKQGESVLLVGSNGAGKSSLINAVVGLVPTASGRIIFDGKDLGRISSPARARLGIGYSPRVDACSAR